MPDKVTLKPTGTLTPAERPTNQSSNEIDTIPTSPVEPSFNRSKGMK